jgi:hypothetical protein
MRSRRHLPAAFGACPARCDARVHAADAFAVFGAFRADLGTFAAGVFVVRRVKQHDMLSAGHQAMIHRGAETGSIAAQTDLDAAVRLFSHLHGSILSGKALKQNGAEGTVFPAELRGPAANIALRQ